MSRPGGRALSWARPWACCGGLKLGWGFGSQPYMERERLDPRKSFWWGQREWQALTKHAPRTLPERWVPPV